MKRDEAVKWSDAITDRTCSLAYVGSILGEPQGFYVGVTAPAPYLPDHKFFTVTEAIAFLNANRAR